MDAGGVSLAQTYGHLFDHRMKAAEDVAQLNTSLMQAIKSQNVKGVVSLLKQGSSPNFKDEAGWTPLQRACRSDDVACSGRGCDYRCSDSDVA